MRFSIIDCYTDEPSGLGVMPYIGTYPRYIFGAITKCRAECHYLTIDDIRSIFKKSDIEHDMRTNISVRNLTPNNPMVGEILRKSDVIIVISGLHTPGKYLSAYPGTTVEVRKLFERLGIGEKFKILTGPAATAGSGMFGGRMARSAEGEDDFFNLIVPELEYRLDGLLESNFTDVPGVEDKYARLREIAPLGAAIVPQLPYDPSFHIAELETMSGCAKEVPCSFCVEKIKSKEVARRQPRDIIEEASALSRFGIRNFRVGKQTCIYSYGSNEDLKELFRPLSEISKVLHIDNANPLFVTEEKTRTLVEYCSPGNVASLGVESFDPKVIKQNELKNDPEGIYGVIELINRLGSVKGGNGMPMLLPGVNILFGLEGESKNTHSENMAWLKRIYEDGLLLRRINIREVVIFPGTSLSKRAGNKYLRKNRKYYWKWRNDIRSNIDQPMLERLLPKGSVLRSLRTEVYDGKTTFARQVGSYPIIAGISGRIGLDRIIDARVVGHMRRSVVAEEVPHSIG
ncbi:MAG: radical SAM protein [Candidatus Methanofastidiosa archaeon]|nr:radical SAM protein [Candidatus Methanofastidiosa archaeon]